MLNKINLRNRVVFVSVASVMLIGIVGAGWASRLLGQKRTDKSLTRALEVTNVIVVNGRAKVSLKNVSSKNVNGIQVLVGGNLSQIEFLDADEPSHQRLLPDATYEEWFLLGNTSEPVEVSVLAVTFDDNDADGDPSLVKEITDTRRGVKKQLMHFAPILKDALRSTNADSPAILETLKAKIDALPSEDSGDSGAMKMSQHKAKQQLYHEIEAARRLRLIAGSGQVRQRLTDIDSRQDKKIRDLP